MFKQWKGFLSGIIFTLAVIVLSGAVFAAAAGTSITVYYDNIKILLNGREIDTKDINGNNAEPFIYNGSAYVPVRAVSEALNNIVEWDADSKNVLIYETEVDKFWDRLNHSENEPVINNYPPDLYLRYIDAAGISKVYSFIEKYGADVLFKGLKSMNLYSQYYCINMLVEYYNDEDIRTRAIAAITPFLKSTCDKIRDGAEFAISVLSKKFDSPYIINGADGVKIFTLFNNYSDYGSYHRIWIIKDGKLSEFYSYKDSHMYIDAIIISPDKDKIAVKTNTRITGSYNIIDLNSGKISPDIMLLAIKKVAADNKNYDNTYADGRYCWGDNLKWIDNNTVEFEADIAFNWMEIIERVTVRYNVSDNSVEYVSLNKQNKENKEGGVNHVRTTGQ